jgi:hypothetical protein
VGYYLVERYLPGITEQELTEATARLRAAAEREALCYLGSTFVPAEEACFCRFEAPSREAVERACRRADVPFARITEARAFPTERGQACESSP